MERSNLAKTSNSKNIRELATGRVRPIGGQGAQLSIAEKSVQEILLILRKWGINTIGQFATLDKEELAVRLGPQAVRLWERANGKSNRLLKFVRLPESFQESFEFEHEIETAEPLLFMLRRFLEQLVLRLNAIYLVAKEITLQITFSNSRQNEPAVAGKQSYERLFKIPQPTNDVDLLFRMFQTYLENFKSEHPIVAVALIAEPIKPAFRQFGLFEIALRDPQQLYETLGRLTALLGTDRVGTPVLEETHRPEAFRMEPFSWQLDTDATEFLHPGASARAPLPEGEDGGEGHRDLGSDFKSRIALRRFRPPEAASIFSSEHWHLQSEVVQGKVIDQRGPYLLSGNWWDEKVWARAEWDLELEDGSLVRAHEAEGVWKIDGIYD